LPPPHEDRANPINVITAKTLIARCTVRVFFILKNLLQKNIKKPPAKMYAKTFFPWRIAGGVFPVSMEEEIAGCSRRHEAKELSAGRDTT